MRFISTDDADDMDSNSDSSNSNDEDTVAIMRRIIREAKKLKEKGDEACNQDKDYRSASEYYRDAIRPIEVEDLDYPGIKPLLVTLYSNLAEAYHRLGVYNLAKRCCNFALCLDSSHKPSIEQSTNSTVAIRRYEDYSKPLNDSIIEFKEAKDYKKLCRMMELSKLLSISAKDGNIDASLKCQVLLAQAESELELARALAEVSTSEEANKIACKVHLSRAHEFCQEVNEICDDYVSDFLGFLFLEDSIQCTLSRWHLCTNQALSVLLSYKIRLVQELWEQDLGFEELQLTGIPTGLSQETLHVLYLQLQPSLAILKSAADDIIDLYEECPNSIPEEVRRRNVNVVIEILQEMAKLEVLGGQVPAAQCHVKRMIGFLFHTSNRNIVLSASDDMGSDLEKISVGLENIAISTLQEREGTGSIPSTTQLILYARARLCDIANDPEEELEI